MSLIIPMTLGQINIRREAGAALYSERYELVPTIVMFGLRFTWRSWPERDRLFNIAMTLQLIALIGFEVAAIGWYLTFREIYG